MGDRDVQHERVFALDSTNVIRLLTSQLIGSGYRVEHSFDLRSATSRSSEFPCPYHGAVACDCQFVILLVHAPQGVMPLMLHECEGFTRLQFDVASAELQTCLLAAVSAIRDTVMAET
jgi:hypothetical protein